MTGGYLVSGLGSIGKRHLENLRALRPTAPITVLRRPESLPMEEMDGQLRFVHSIEEAISHNLSAAILAGPATTHVAQARKLVEHGVPVLIEKPLSTDLDGLEELARSSLAQNVPVMIGYNLRFNRSLLSAKAAIEAGAIGRIHAVRAEVGQYLPDWRPGSDYTKGVSARRELGGGPLLELSHEIDLVYWMNGMPDCVVCRGGRYSNLDIDVEDCVEICLEYESSRKLVSIHLDFLQRPASRSCKFIGSEGVLIWDGIKDHYKVMCNEPDQAERCVTRPPPDRNQMYLDELSAFLIAVENQSMVPIPLSEGIAVMHIIDAASASMRSGKVVALNLARGRQ